MEKRILHVSDLRVGTSTADPAAVLSELETLLTGQSIDYLVVCGNVTEHGTAYEFERAQALLARAASRLLRLDPDSAGGQELRLSRMLVLPGSRDAAGRTPLRAFARFHDALFATEIELGRVERFEPENLMIRELKDLTLIGAHYWNMPKRVLNSRLLDQMLAAVRRRPLDRLSYSRFTPTVLASADTPLHGDEGDANIRALRDQLCENLDVKLHLIGPADTGYLLPEPHRFRHLSISTGPRDGSGFWPFRANLIHMNAGPPGPEEPSECNSSKGDPLPSTRFWVKRSPQSAFAPYSHIMGQLDRLVDLPLHQADNDTVFAEVLAEIQVALTAEEELVFVTGVPGSGKSDLFTYLIHAHPARLADHVASLVIEPHEGYDRNRLSRKLKPALDHLRQGRGTRMLVIRDRYYAELKEEKRTEISEAVQFLRDQLGPDQLNYIVYLVPSVAPTHEMANGEAKLVVLRPAQASSFERLVKEFAWRIPIKSDDVARLTGGLVGLSRLTLKSAEERFADYAGAEPLRDETGRLLAWSAMESASDASRETAKLQESLTGVLGLPMMAFLRGCVDAARHQIRNDRYAAPITFTRDQLVRARDGGCRPEMGIGYLIEMGIVSEDDGVYTIRVVAPFLSAANGWAAQRPGASSPPSASVRRTRASGAGRGRSDWQRLENVCLQARWGDSDPRAGWFDIWEEVFAEFEVEHPVWARPVPHIVRRLVKELRTINLSGPAVHLMNLLEPMLPAAAAQDLAVLRARFEPPIQPD